MLKIILILILEAVILGHCKKISEKENNAPKYSIWPLALLGTSADNKSSSSWIGPEGGILRSSDGSFSLEIPQGALKENTYITITKDATSVGKVSEEYINRTPIYSFEPHGLNFSIPAKFTTTYNQSDMSENKIEERTTKFFYIKDDSTLESTKTISVDYAKNQLVSEINHFSFGVALTVRISLVNLGIITSPSAVNNIANAVINALSNPPSGMTTTEYFQDNLSILTTFLEQLIDILGYNPIDTAFPYLFNPVVTYTIGGNLTGLSGTLQLQNNSGNNLILTTNGSFSFSNKIAVGSNYNVSVYLNPTGQSCTVSNGSGVASLDISNVGVNCVTNTHSIGGSISGLSGTIEIQNNNSNNLVLSSNGNFSFSGAELYGAGYNVSVLNQPVGQTCTVSSGNGNATSNITNISIVCSINTYNIGGTISGLAGSIVLQNNNTNDLTLNSSGSFNFSNQSAYGANYSVTIKTPPSNQYCTISNGNGISNFNIVNIQINCVTAIYSVSGTISSLMGSIVLQNNGGDNLTLNSNGQFSFNQLLPSGGSYSVSVLTQPLTGSSPCIVSNGTGNANGNITNVTVACRSICGSGFVDGTKQCDDGNLVNNDGCSNECKIESGWTCSGSYLSVCTRPTYSVSGTVRSMMGQIVLQNNGTDNLTLSADGQFTFAQRLLSGSPYQVTILNQANNWTGPCVVSNGSGTINGSVTDVSVTCRGVCGNGIVDGPDECDDGNTFGTDGCSSECKIESGYTCTGNDYSVCLGAIGARCYAPYNKCLSGNCSGGFCSN